MKEDTKDAVWWLVFIVIVGGVLWFVLGCQSVFKTFSNSMLDAVQDRIPNKQTVGDIARNITETVEKTNAVLRWVWYGMLSTIAGNLAVMLHRYFFHGHIDRFLTWIGHVLIGRSKRGDE
jgi:putative Mn2+ efflux pump MntP